MNNTLFLTQEQILLFKIILDDNQNMIDYWYQWNQTVDIESIESETYNLLPLVYHHLSKNKIKTEEDSRLKGIYRRSWYNNQLHLNNVNKILESLNQVNIFPIILGDCAMAQFYYPELATRNIFSYELFVIPDKINQTIQLLKNLGWKIEQSNFNKRKNIYSKIRMINEHKNSLCLSWDLPIERNQINCEENILSITEEILINNNRAYILKPIPQILNLILQNSLSNYKYVTRFTLDLSQILTKDHFKISIKNLQKKITEFYFNYSYHSLVTQLEFLKINNSPLSIYLENSFSSDNISSIELKELAFINQENIITIKDKLTRLYLRYFRIVAKSNNKLEPIKFLTFLNDYFKEWISQEN